MRTPILAVALAVLVPAAFYAADEAEVPSPSETLGAYLNSAEPDAEQKGAALALVKKAQIIRLYYKHDTPAEDLTEATRFALSLKASFTTPVSHHTDGKTFPQIDLVFSTFFGPAQKLTPEQWLAEMQRPIEAGYELTSVEVVLTPSRETKRESLAKSQKAVKALGEALEKAKPDFPQLNEFAANTSVRGGRWERGDWPWYPHLHYEHAIGPDKKGAREKLADDWCSVSFGFHVLTGNPSQRPSTGRQEYPLQGIAAVWNVQTGNEGFYKEFDRLALAALEPLDKFEAELRGDEPQPEPIVIRGQTYYPISAEEMRRAGFDVPKLSRAENAAFVYYEAINAYWEPERGSETADLRDDVVKYGWWEDAEALSEYLERNRKALELVEKAASMEACFFPIMLSSKASRDDVLLAGTRIPQATGMRELARLCVVQGREFEYDGEPDKVLECYLFVLRVGNDAACAPFLIGGLVGLNCNTLGLTVTESCILRGELDDSTLAGVQGRLHTLSARRPSFGSVINNERAYTAHEIEYTVRHPGWNMGGEKAWLSELDSYGMSPDEWKDLMRTDYAVYWQLADEYLKMPLPEFLKNSAGEKLSELLSFGEGRRPQNVMLMLASSIGSIRVVYARGDLHWMILDIECALTRYRTRHGRYPDKLDELKDLMLSDGIDPFSGKPLHYRLEDDGSFTIWSAGRNLADDGGALPDKHDPWRGEDYVWNSRLLSAGN